MSTQSDPEILSKMIMITSHEIFAKRVTYLTIFKLIRAKPAQKAFKEIDRLI